MSILNTFLLNLDRGLTKYPSEDRERMRTRILDDLKKDDILHPSYTALLLGPDDDDEISISEIREERVKVKQKELRIPPDESKVKYKYGRTQLHEAVVISDLELIRRLLRENHSVYVKDNNGNTPVDHAILDENIEVLSIFKEFGHNT